MDIYEQLRRDEGVRRFPYVDSVGKTSIGVGHNLTDKGVTDAQVDLLLHDDVEEVTNALLTVPWYMGLDEIRKAVIVNMCFNMGLSGLLAFHKMISFIEAGQYDEAATEMLSSRWSSQVGVRATRLALQLKSGEWQ